MRALIFDCDGVLVDTERHGHRVAFNKAFVEHGLDVEWQTEQYGELVKVSGGKERMRYYFNREGWPKGVNDRDALVLDLHKTKTEQFRQIIERRELPLRSGVARLIDEAIAAGVSLAVCSTSNIRSVTAIVERLLGIERKARFDCLLAGDVVRNKKPDPEIYELAKQRLGLPGDDCVVVEDSRNGLLAAHTAGIPCLVTTSPYTKEEDFSEALRVVPELGDPPGACVTLSDLRALAASPGGQRQES